MSKDVSLTPDRLADLGWTPADAEAFLPYTEQHWPARVARVDRGAADLIDVNGAVRATVGGEVLRESIADRSLAPTVGDWVAVREWPDGRTTIEAILPRRTAVIRDASGRTSHGQALAANVDVVLIVEPLDPEPALGRVERLLVIAGASGATPIVVLTKPDLVPDPVGMLEEVVAVAPGTDVIAANPTSGAGLDALHQHLAPGRTMVTLGPSGAGKSSLVNSLAGREVMQTGAVRPSDSRGRHVTKHRELIVLPGAGVFVDTPGLRAVGLVADGEAVSSAFSDVEELAGQCRFRDCTHETEPGCAVKEALDDGSLTVTRFESWVKLKKEADTNQRRAEYRLRSNNRRDW